MLNNGWVASCSCGKCIGTVVGGTAVGGTGGPIIAGYLVFRYSLRHQNKVGQWGVGVRASMTQTSLGSGWFIQLCRRRLGGTQVRIE